MENKMIECLLNEIFLKKDNKISNVRKSAGPAGKVIGTDGLRRPNYQRSKNNFVAGDEEIYHRQPKSNDDLNVFEMMRIYTR